MKIIPNTIMGEEILPKNWKENPKAKELIDAGAYLEATTVTYHNSPNGEVWAYLKCPWLTGFVNQDDTKIVSFPIGGEMAEINLYEYISMGKKVTYGALSFPRDEKHRLIGKIMVSGIPDAVIRKPDNFKYTNGKWSSWPSGHEPIDNGQSFEWKYCQECKKKYRPLTKVGAEYFSSDGMCWPCYSGMYDLCYGAEEEDYEYVEPEAVADRL